VVGYLAPQMCVRLRRRPRLGPTLAGLALVALVCAPAEVLAEPAAARLDGPTLRIGPTLSGRIPFMAGGGLVAEILIKQRAFVHLNFQLGSDLPTLSGKRGLSAFGEGYIGYALVAWDGSLLLSGRVVDSAYSGTSTTVRYQIVPMETREWLLADLGVMSGRIGYVTPVGGPLAPTSHGDYPYPALGYEDISRQLTVVAVGLRWKWLWKDGERFNGRSLAIHLLLPGQKREAGLYRVPKVNDRMTPKFEATGWQEVGVKASMIMPVWVNGLPVELEGGFLPAWGGLYVVIGFQLPFRVL
jgi:hypothetical protein